MSDYSGEVMAEVLAQQALVKPQIIPLVPIVNQYRHQDHLDLKVRAHILPESAYLVCCTP